MIIEVNLLPGRQSSRRGSSPAAGALADRLKGAFRDRYLTAAVAMLVGTSAAIGALQLLQTRDAADLAERETVAVSDSTRYSSVIKDRKLALAERDSVEKQLAIIAAIDSNRYVWAHVLDEVSQTLPAYTWLTSVEQTSAAPSPRSSRCRSTSRSRWAASRCATGRSLDSTPTRSRRC